MAEMRVINIYLWLSSAAFVYDLLYSAVVYPGEKRGETGSVGPVARLADRAHEGLFPRLVRGRVLFCHRFLQQAAQRAIHKAHMRLIPHAASVEQRNGFERAAHIALPQSGQRLFVRRGSAGTEHGDSFTRPGGQALFQERTPAIPEAYMPPQRTIVS